MQDRRARSGSLGALLVLLSLAACDEGSGVGGGGSWDGWLALHVPVCLRHSACADHAIDECLLDTLRDDYLEARSVCVSRSDCFERTLEDWDSISRTSSCEEYYRRDVPSGQDSCDPSIFDERCEGDTLVDCGYYRTGEEGLHLVRRRDCGDLFGGGRCVESGELGYPHCESLRCVQYDEGPPECEGDLFLACEPHEYEPIFWVISCANLGKICDPEVGCRLPGLSCDQPPHRRYCDGPLITRCWAGKPQTSDCREIDPEFVCLDAEERECGLPTDRWECLRHGSTWCEGSIALTCLRGRLVSVNCAEIPGATCVLESDEYSTHTYCRTPPHP